MNVLGVDLGLRDCGYVLCEVRGLQVDLIKEGQIKPDPKQPLPHRLHDVFSVLEKEMSEYKPSALIVEKLYSHYRHPTTLGVLAQVRGVIALLACQKGVDFFEYSPTRARKSFLGQGNADSQRVKKMAENVMGIEFKSIHTADAFSLVIAFSHAQKMLKIRKSICLTRS
ncbi:MAG: crossover junction endodeoxyribonuclease RuvC [Candidatus Omnitrophica bacterium]|nr:crossover junction endodeoxyribonuclease RuvC [Candidatus Omnitrophota bacterium]MDD5429691.1 crossover junction endodeoxyribonuclease RuvC [Candidatus Omnitrophota bacterium]